MPYFLNLKGYEMHLFELARLKPFVNQYSSPAPSLQCWGLIGDKEHNFMFQHCHGGAGMILPKDVKFFATILSEIVVSSQCFLVLSLPTIPTLSIELNQWGGGALTS